MKKRTIVTLMVALLGVMVFATGCTNDPAPPAVTPAETTTAPTTTTTTTEPAPPVVEVDHGPAEYRFTMNGDTTTLNAHATTSLIPQTIYNWTHSGLFRRAPHPDGHTSIIVPDLAASEPISMDAEGLVWHIPIRPYAQWHNGTPINAHTFEYSWRMQIDPLLINQMANFLFGLTIEIQNGREYFTQDPPTDWEDVGIRVVDDYTLEIITTRPFRVEEVMTTFLDRSTFPVYEELYEAGMNADRTLTSFGTTLDEFMSAGPFFYVEWVPDALHVFHRNPDHWLAHLFHYDIVTIRVVPDAGARLQLFELGEVDFFDVPAAMIPQFMDDPRLHRLTGVMPTHIDINTLNDDQPILQVREFRRALYFAVDRTTIARLVNQMPAPTYIGHEASTFLGDGTLFRNTPQGIASIPENNGFDPVLARQYFDAAMEIAGETFVTIEFMYSEANDNDRMMAEFLEQSLPEIFGADRFELVLRAAPGAAIGAMRNWRETTEWEITSSAWGTAAQRNFPHQAFTHMINPASRPNTLMPDRFLEQWQHGQELAGEIPLNINALYDIAAELEQLWMYYVVNIPVFHGVTYRLYAERLELPFDEFVPIMNFGEMFGRIRQ